MPKQVALVFQRKTRKSFYKYVHNLFFEFHAIILHRGMIGS